MNKKRKFDLNLLINVATFILGLLGSSLFDAVTKPLLSTEMRVVVVVSILGCTILILTSTFMRNIFVQNAEAIRTVADNMYPTIELLSYESIRNPFTVLIEIIKNAKDLVILDYFPWDSKINPKQDMPDSDYFKYYAALDAFIDRGGHYMRLVQLPNGASKTLTEKDISDPVAIKHLRKALISSKQPHSNVALKTCQISLRNVSFLIIDEKYVSWEIPNVDTNNTFEFSYDFSIDDPKKKIVTALLEMTTQINNQSTPVTEIV